mgnify:CR=1 FL=1|tara:strand:+ start:593 stop:745 length:153 start_codon:yes stop_codon:yes gene_type:complete
MRHPIRCCETREAFHINKDMIKSLDFKSMKKADFQRFRKFQRKKKRPDAN